MLLSSSSARATIEYMVFEKLVAKLQTPAFSCGTVDRPQFMIKLLIKLIKFERKNFHECRKHYFSN